MNSVRKRQLGINGFTHYYIVRPNIPVALTLVLNSHKDIFPLYNLYSCILRETVSCSLVQVTPAYAVEMYAFPLNK